tara:strand:+ start:1327 stop:1734 length:408 start_codon:yes stop_codon:yes gene_type:complete
VIFKKLNQAIILFLSTKFMMWAYPDSKRFVKGLVGTVIVILLTLYFHSEYLGWAEISQNTKFITVSYILKNLIILISIIFLYFYLKKPRKKVYPKVKGEEKIYTKNSNEDYFDKFRNKDKLKTKAERILEKDGKE